MRARGRRRGGSGREIKMEPRPAAAARELKPKPRRRDQSQPSGFLSEQTRRRAENAILCLALPIFRPAGTLAAPRGFSISAADLLRGAIGGNFRGRLSLLISGAGDMLILTARQVSARRHFPAGGGNRPGGEKLRQPRSPRLCFRRPRVSDDRLTLTVCARVRAPAALKLFFR